MHAKGERSVLARDWSAMAEDVFTAVMVDGLHQAIAVGAGESFDQSFLARALYLALCDE